MTDCTGMKKAFVNIMSASMLSMILSVVTNFLIPKFLSIESYGMLKTYSLYISYAGFFALGYGDGMYLKYGGRSIKNIDKDDLSGNFFHYMLVILTGTILVFGIGMVRRIDILIAFSLGIFNYNIICYLKMLYQATGEFSLYSNIINAEKIILFVINMIFIFLFKIDNYQWYIGAQLLTGIIIITYFFCRLQKSIQILRRTQICIHEIKSNIKDGFVLMLGNFSSGIFTGLDRWFIKILMDNTAFAVYSFAVNFEYVINVFFSPITVSMYNYFCRKPSYEEIKFTKRLVMLWGFVIIGGVFPAKFFIQYFLSQYEDSSEIIVALLAAQVFYLIVRGIYVNIYKAQKQQGKYLIQLVLMTITGIVLNVIFYHFCNSMLSIAAATLTTSVIWLVVCEFKNRDIGFTLKDWIAIAILLTAYIYLGIHMDAIKGLIVYFIIVFFVGCVFEFNCVKFVFHQFSEIISKYF